MRLRTAAPANSRQSHGPGQTAHPMLIGLFIGLLLGLCLALGVALYLNEVNPFFGKRAKEQQPAAAKEQKQAPPHAGAPAGMPQAAPQAGPAQGKQADAKRFDFYDILPGRQDPAARPDDKRTAREVLYLQAGAFQRSSDADNLKARLALAGLEARIQTATLPDNSVWHRVRLGPYTDTAEMDRARAVLRENKIESSVIKVTEREPKP